MMCTTIFLSLEVSQEVLVHLYLSHLHPICSSIHSCAALVRTFVDVGQLLSGRDRSGRQLVPPCQRVHDPGDADAFDPGVMEEDKSIVCTPVSLCSNESVVSQSLVCRAVSHLSNLNFFFQPGLGPGFFFSLGSSEGFAALLFFLGAATLQGTTQTSSFTIYISWCSQQ